MDRESMVRRHISIPGSLDDDMRDFIAANSRRWRKGAFSDLVIDAVRCYIEPNTHTQKRNSKKHSNRKLDVLMQEIRDFVTSKYMHAEFTTIHRKHLSQAIATVMNIRDKRSINGWIFKLESNGYIEGERWTDNFEAIQYKILKEGSPETKQNVTISPQNENEGNGRP